MREIPPQGASERDVAAAVISLTRGRSNAVGTVTLRANQTTTVVTNPNINVDSSVQLTAKTANAAAALATTYAVVTAAGTITITHANNAQTDREFHLSFMGG